MVARKKTETHGAPAQKGTGHKTFYRESYVKQARQLAMLGTTDEEMAAVFGVSRPTLLKWRDKYPEFEEAIMDGKLAADARVAEALYKRAVGYEHEEEKIFLFEGEPVKVKTIKHYPPDTTAASLWLRNRRHAQAAPHAPWKDKHDIEFDGGLKVISDQPQITAEEWEEKFAPLEREH